MRDIVERLRAGHRYSGIISPLQIEAAAEIERLRAALDRRQEFYELRDENERLRAALEVKERADAAIGHILAPLGTLT
jgi:cell shape-determining protein MreC